MTDMGTSSSDGSADAEREDLEVEEAVRSVVADGYEDRFASVGGGVVRCSSCAGALPLESSALESAHPARDTPTARSGLLVAALRCPRCGTLGHAVLDVDEWTPAEDRAAGSEDRDGPTGGLSVNADTHKTAEHPLGDDREHMVLVEDGDTRSLRDRGTLVDAEGDDIREYTGEPVETDEGTVIPQQQNVGPGNEAGGGEWPDPGTPPAQ